MTTSVKLIQQDHLQAALDAILGIDPSQAPTDPERLDERLTSSQRGITDSLNMLVGSGQAKHLTRGAPLAYVLVEAATRAYPEQMKAEIGQRSFATSIAAVAPEAKNAVSRDAGDEAPSPASMRARQPALVKWLDEQLLSEGSFAAKLTTDERTGIYALCLGTLRAVDRHLAGAEKPVTAAKVPGRNDPCHCGSGKKYKKCHAGPGASASS